MRRAGRELLSLALIDARNRTLRWLSAFAGADVTALAAEFSRRCGWSAMWRGSRNVRSRATCAARRARDRSAPRRWRRSSRAPMPGSIHRSPRASSAGADTDVADAHLRDYLAATLEATLELLERAPEDDAGLQLFRLALANEDAAAETLAVMAQAAAVGGPATKARAPTAAAPAASPGGTESAGTAALTQGLWPIWPSRVRREPLWFGAQRISSGLTAWRFRARQRTLGARRAGARIRDRRAGRAVVAVTSSSSTTAATTSRAGGARPAGHGSSGSSAARHAMSSRPAMPCWRSAPASCSVWRPRRRWPM